MVAALPRALVTDFQSALGLNPVQTAIAVIPFTLAQLAVLLLVKRRPQFPHRYLLRRGC